MTPMLARIRRSLVRRRSLFATALELGGFALVVSSAWRYSPTLGLLVAGVVLLVIAFVLEARRQ